MKPVFMSKGGRPARFPVIALALTVGMAAALIGASAANANGVPFKKGDVLADVGGGIIKHFNAKGELLDELNTTTGTTEGDGMCFDASGNLYATQGFLANTMSKFDNNGNLLAANFGSGYNAHPESCVFSSANEMYVGQPDGSKEVLKFNTSGELLASFGPETESRGTDWVDLASDQCTLEYTSEGSALKAYNVCTKTQLPNKATGLPGPCYGHRILSDESDLVACTSVVEHVNAKGEIIHTYEPEPGAFLLFALNLDPDGETFWTANYFNGTVYRINIASGEVVAQFSAEPLNSVLGGLAIVGEVTCSEAQIKLAPLTAENPVGTQHTVTATVSECGKAVSGATVKFTVTGANPKTGTGTSNAAGEATFSYTGEHAGTDHIVASFVNKKGETETSNEVTKTWTGTVTAAAPLSAGYWKTHLTKGSPNTTQFLPQFIGSYKVDTTEKASAIFRAMTCSNASAQNVIGCLAGQLLATELNLANGSDKCIAPAVTKDNAWLSGTTEDGVPGITYTGPNTTYTLTKAQRSEALALMNPLGTYNAGGGC